MKLTLTLAKILLKEVLEVWRPGKEAATGKWNSQHLSLSGTGCSHWPCQLWAPTAAGITGHLTPLRMDWMMLGCYCFTIAVEGVWLGEPQSHSCASAVGGQKEETQKLQVPWGGGVPCLYPGSSGHSSQRGRGSRCWTVQYMSSIYTNLYFKVFSNTQNTSILLHEDSLIYFVMIHEDSWFSFLWVYSVILLEIKTVPGI